MFFGISGHPLLVIGIIAAVIVVIAFIRKRK